MNDNEAERIAGALNIARPDWPKASILTMIRKNLMSRPRRDVFVALAWVASEPNSHTPARVLESGPWWRAAAVENPSPQGKRGPICLHCGFERSDCETRWNGEHAFEGPDDWMRRRLPDEVAAKRVERMREDIHEAKAAVIPEPADKPETPPNPNVDRLRQVTAAPVPDTHAATPHDTEGAHT